MTTIRNAVAALALALLSLPGAGALEAPVAVRPTWGVLVENVLDSASPAFNPSITFNLGAGFIMPFSADSSFSFVPSADFYYYSAALNARGRAVPAEYSQSSAFVLGLLLDAPVVFSFPLGDKFSAGAGLGLCLDIRAAFTTDPLKADDTPAINEYLWGSGRFILPSTILRAEYQLTDRVSFGFKGRMLWPISNLWANEGYGFLDHSIYLIDLAILYRFGASTKAAPADPTPAAP